MAGTLSAAQLLLNWVPVADSLLACWVSPLAGLAIFRCCGVCGALLFYSGKNGPCLAGQSVLATGLSEASLESAGGEDRY